MEVWRVDQVDRPKVMSMRNFMLALGLHIGFALLLMLYSVINFKSEEKVIPIDLTVVVNENLDGNENEPPPLDDPPPPPKPAPKPKPAPEKIKEPEKPKALEQIITNIVKKVDKKEEKKKEPPKKEPPKKEPPKKPEPPKKTKKELREERLKKMRESATKSNKKVEIKVKNAPSGNGRTDRKTLTNDQIRDLLNQGYKPGKTTQLAASDEQLGISLIKAAFEAKWDKPPWTDTLKPMVVHVWFGPTGKIVNYKLESSSGDRNADRTILTAASRVGSIPTLPRAFIERYRTDGVSVRFKVTPQ